MEPMDIQHKLKEGERVFTQEVHMGVIGAWNVEVEIVDVLEDNTYRIRPVAGHGTKVVHILQLFF